MASFALTDADLTVNSVDLSAFVRSVTLDTEAESLDDTNMGDTWHTVVSGRRSGTLNIEFTQDYAASATKATIDAAEGTVVAFVLKPTSSAVSTTNPSYSGNVHISSNVVGGSYGELAMMSVSWPTSGAVTKATS